MIDAVLTCIRRYMDWSGGEVLLDFVLPEDWLLDANFSQSNQYHVIHSVTVTLEQLTSDLGVASNQCSDWDHRLQSSIFQAK